MWQNSYENDPKKLDKCAMGAKWIEGDKKPQTKWT